MRSCPTCNRAYQDATLKFCRVDGAELVDAARESETIKFSEPQLEMATTTSRLAVPPSIAVLPFADLSSDHSNEYFCDGLAEEILNALTKLNV